MKKYIALTAVLLSLIGSSSAYYVGVAPGVNEIGEIDRGETREFEFYIQTDRDNLEVDTSLTRPSTQILRDGYAYDYGIEKNEYSAEPISDWISFREPEYYDNRKIETEKGGTITVDGKLTYFLDIPQDAEPGYHIGIVKLNPSITGGDATVNTRSVSDHVFVFRVPGNAERSVEVENVEALRTGDSTVRLEAEARNTGTVTTRVVSSDADILSDSGQKITDYNIGGEFIEPGETKTITSGWSSNEGDITAGNYQTRGQLNYLTGQAFFSDSLAVTDYIQIENADNESSNQIIPGDGSGDSPPLMLIVIALVLSGSIMYAFEIDPLLIIMAIAVLGISSVIWFTALPVSMIGMVVLLSAGLFYYGWM